VAQDALIDASTGSSASQIVQKEDVTMTTTKNKKPSLLSHFTDPSPAAQKGSQAPDHVAAAFAGLSAQSSLGSGANIDFQVASCTLDMGIKIWSMRVDSVYSDMFKVLGDLERSENDPNQRSHSTQSDQGSDESFETGADKGDEERETAAATKTRKAKKVLQNTGNTIEKNPDSLNETRKKQDFALGFDPLLQKAAVSYEETGAKGLLLNRLGASDAGHIAFESSFQDPSQPSRFHVSEKEKKERRSRVNISSFLQSLSSISSSSHPWKNLSICPSFESFRFENSVLSEDSSSQLMNLDDTMESVPDDATETDQTADSEDFPLPLLEDTLPDLLPIQKDDIFASQESQFQPDPFGLDEFESAHLTRLISEKTDRDDYSYFDADGPKHLKTSNWAGPQHWKFAPSTSLISDQSPLLSLLKSLSNSLSLSLLNSLS